MRDAATKEKALLRLPSGRYIDLKDPQPEDITLADLAHSLSQICRWGGHSPWFYSVAEHACLVHDLVESWRHGLRSQERLRQAALHHDDHEAFLGDVPTPLKKIYGDVYSDLAEDFDSVIGAALGITMPWLWFGDPVIEAADRVALFLEADVFGVEEGLPERPEVVELPAGVTWACGLSPGAARAAYLERHAALHL